MKQIYTIGTLQEFTYTTPAIPPLIWKSKKEEHWVIRNIKYIYANDENQAKEKYKNWFFEEYPKITQKFINWDIKSDNEFDYEMNERYVNITSTQIIKVDGRVNNATLLELKECMQAEDFKEWWFDNKSCD